MAYTRHGTARAGDDYQDLCGAQIRVQYLEHPDRYQWVRFEADEAGYLDDVVALRSDGRVVAMRVKFTTHPEEPEREICRSYLLRRPRGGGQGQSPLQKWSTSMSSLRALGPIHDVGLYTDRRASPEFASVLGRSGTGLVSFADVDDRRVREEISEQLGGDDRAAEFFGTFRFYVDRPDPSTLEEGLRRRFFALSGNESGWLDLLSEIRVWAKRKDEPLPDGCTRYASMTRAADWYELLDLPQDFEIPATFVLPSEQFHQAILEPPQARRRPIGLHQTLV